MNRKLVGACFALTVLATAPLAGMAIGAPTEWDGLAKVPAKRAHAAYLLPGASFSGYTKVMLDPTEVAFRKNWLRDYNSATRQPGARISESQAQAKLSEMRTAADQIFAKSFAGAGYQLVNSPGPDILRIRVFIINLRINAPYVMTAGRSRTYAPEAGSATLVVEARDAESGQLLGRAVDARVAGDVGGYMRTSVSNRADFERLLASWAKDAAAGLAELKADAR
ncbi:MAG TPA: DUF3313 family protein [Caulobacteraceae bacterium]